MYFYIKQNATLPTLRMELIEDGRHSFRSFHDSIQNAEITMTMTNVDTNVTKIAQGSCYIMERNVDSCDEEYVICYDWKKRDTKEAGTFRVEFTIEFGEISTDDEHLSFPIGTLVMPIREELYVTIL